MEAIGTQLWLILGLPLLGFLLQSLCGGIVVRSLGVAKGRTVMGWIAFFMVFLPFVFAMMITMALANAPEEGRTEITATAAKARSPRCSTGSACSLSWSRSNFVPTR